jgi:hypothetical protein
MNDEPKFLNLRDLRAPGCAGNLFIGSRNCPQCGSFIQITIENVRNQGTGFAAFCLGGHDVAGSLTTAEQELVHARQ